MTIVSKVDQKETRRAYKHNLVKDPLKDVIETSTGMNCSWIKYNFSLVVLRIPLFSYFSWQMFALSRRKYRLAISRHFDKEENMELKQTSYVAI